jgi:hypothetical protein
VLTVEEARTLLDSIPVTRTVKVKGAERMAVSCVVGLRDRALIGLMVFTFARANYSFATGLPVQLINY